MEQKSKCCGAKKMIKDNWASNKPDADIRFLGVCSNCKNEFEPEEIKSCPTCHADLPHNHPLRNENRKI